MSRIAIAGSARCITEGLWPEYIFGPELAIIAILLGGDSVRWRALVHVHAASQQVLRSRDERNAVAVPEKKCGRYFYSTWVPEKESPGYAAEKRFALNVGVSIRSRGVERAVN